MSTEHWLVGKHNLDSWNSRLGELDAFKAGERFAAEITQHHHMAGIKKHKSCREAILTDANNRTELP